MRFDPQHPDAGADGYVAYPDINPLTEMVDLIWATRGVGNIPPSAEDVEDHLFLIS